MSTIGEAILMVRVGPDEGTSVPLSGGITMMGRAELNDVVLVEPGVSRQHPGIRGDAEGYWNADLGSRNGTYVNSKKLGADPRRFRNFDRIELGGTDTTLHWIFMESQSTIDVPRPSS